MGKEKKGKDRPGLGENHPAYQAILEATNDIVTAYRDDILVHDADLIRRFPEARFFYFCRDSGSHLIPLELSTEGSSHEDAETVKLLMRSNTHHFYWTGDALIGVPPDWVSRQLEKTKPLVIQL